MEEQILIDNQEESAKKIQAEIEKIIIDNPESAPEVSGSDEIKIPVGDILTPEEFEDRFIELFDVAEDITEIDGLRVNRDSKFELAGAKKTAQKLYTCAEKYKIMHFMIENKGGWLADAVLIGGFCYAKANIVVSHYSGQSLSTRLMMRFKRLPEAVQKKAGIFGRFFKKEVENESEKA